MQKMETRYETIKKMKSGFTSLVRMGFIPVHLTMWVVIFEAHKKQLETHNVSQAVEFVAMDYDLQRRQVYHIIKYMNTTFEIQ